ncbi:MAG TPA: energy transducer TonB [Thermoanaerobaculia bacterium]
MLASSAPGCRKTLRPGAAGAPADDRAVVTLDKVPGRAEPSARSAAPSTLVRGTPVRIREAKGDLLRVSGPGGDVWVPAAAVERLADREAREARAEAVKAFEAQPGRAVEPCPILLAPDYGAARWGTLEDGDDVDVVLADHDFFGVRLAGKMLAFVPARSIRLLPSAVAPAPGSPPGKGVTPEVQSLGVPDRETRPTPRATAPPAGEIPSAGFAPAATPAPGAAQAAPLTALPEGSELPVLITRADPKYPEAARKLKLGGDVVLRVVVEANGSIGRIEVVTGAPFGMTEAATDAVRKWTYRPARVNGQVVAVWKVIRVKFALHAEREPPPD